MEHSKLRPFGFGKRNSGIALILVLMLVVLITIMILAFFLSTQTETKSMRSVVSGQNSRQLADIAVQSVISQIQLATTQGGTTNAWVSQPGMIRTYNNSGTAVGWYKLYSASTNFVSNPAESLANVQADLPTQAWAYPGSANYGVYTDINSPVYAANGTSLEYPIVNPGSATSLATASTNVVLGFDIAASSVTGYNASSSYAPTNNPAAMPVRWIYILADGTQVPAGPATGTPGTVTVLGASTSNPIVGRIAYWTDDETCKLNVNTAADGTYFDTPRFTGTLSLPTSTMQTLSSSGADASGSTQSPQDLARIQDYQLSVTPPFAGEYQHFIGGPAQTRLSYVLPALTTQGLVPRSQLMTQLTPFMQWGGSQGGIVSEWDNLTTLSNLNLSPPARQTPYASLDEWMFTTQLNGTTRIQTPQNVSGTPGLLTNTRLQQLRFFLSANSDAPEVTLAGQPRIAIWPLTSSIETGPDLLPGVATTPYTTALDRMLAKAATLTPTPTPSGGWSSPAANNSPIANYYFTRYRSATSSGALSPYLDWNGTSSTSEFISTAPVTRNQSLYALLYNEAATAIPGYGGTFKTKYGADPMNQILTEIFDYIRCTNIDDQTPSPATGTFTPYSISRQDVTTASPSPGGYDGGGQVAPIIINNGNQYVTQGFGRFYTVNGLALDLIYTGSTTTGSITITPVLYPSLFSPSVGPSNINPDMRIEIPPGKGTATGLSGASNGISNFTLNTQPLFSGSFTGAKTTYSVMTIAGNPLYSSGNRWNDDSNGNYNAFLWGGDAGPRLLTGFQSSYPFIGTPVLLPKSTGTLTFVGGPITIKVSCNYGQVDATNSTSGEGFPDPNPSADLVQTITLTFPNFTFSGLPTGSFTSVASLAGTLGDSEVNWNYPINTGDVVRSIVAGYNGDMRLIAAQHTVTMPTGLTPASTPPSLTGTTTSATQMLDSPFVEHPLWTSTFTSTVASAHALRDIFAFPAVLTLPGFSSAGQLIPSTTATYTNPTVNGYVSNTTGSGTYAPQVTRDFDNGPGIYPDGPYINKPDESGNQYINYNSYNGSNYYYSGMQGSTEPDYCSPNRTIASPVMFGSLPTGVPLANALGGPIAGAGPTPWRTLLFHPQAGHPGETSPEDELLLDWFWMPVVEPYAISNTFDTEGKVNMNYQIAPFTYMTRSTALMGVLGSEYVIAVPNSAGNASGTAYKSPSTSSSPSTPYRIPVKVLESDNVTPAYTDGTLEPFQYRFGQGQIFKSAAEICDIYLTPVSAGTTWTSWDPPGAPTTSNSAEAFWSNNLLTGDNSRERPYNGLYSRLTTKSNTYTVHVRAQALAMPKTTPAGEWIENPQLITSEYRGSVTVNRYLDPEDPNIPDFALPSNSMKYSLDSYYKYRVLEARRFLP